MTLRVIPVLALSFAVSLRAQPREFEVASVKVSKGGGVTGGCHGIDSQYTPIEAASAPPLGRCVIHAGRLSHLIAIAYRLTAISLIHGAPDWVLAGYDRFDIEAKVEDPTKVTEEQLLTLLQNLLVERFKMKFHREEMDRSGFGLVVGRRGPKLQPSTDLDESTSFGTGIKPALRGPINLVARRYSMPTLANLLSNFASGPIVDKTGLPGYFDIKLSWNETEGPALTTALQEQLGLRLEPQKVPVSLFVIESAQKPSEN